MGLGEFSDLILFGCFDTRSYQVAQADLSLDLKSICLSLPKAGKTVVCHHATLELGSGFMLVYGLGRSHWLSWSEVQCEI